MLLPNAGTAAAKAVEAAAMVAADEMTGAVEAAPMRVVVLGSMRQTPVAGRV